MLKRIFNKDDSINIVPNHIYISTQDRLAPMWQQSGTLLFCSCPEIAGFLVDELQI